MKNNFVTIILCLFVVANFYAQPPKKPNANEIYQSLEKLNFLGSVLYLAAHPDDENTKLISYLSNNIHARTAYLSLTRGDGGQNLIGPEIRESLGVIRTNELLQAREVDGGEQFFSRANDFGYSKTPKETLEIWNKDEVLSDVVNVIRTFQPDVIINRFDANTSRETHGHHTTSAKLSIEAFDLAANNNYQVNSLKPWQVQRLFFNTSWWFYGSKEKFEKADKSKMIAINTGIYYPSKGVSNTEIAALSRSKHKSQGFGATGTRGDQNEYLKLIKGDFPKNKNNLFEGVDTSWLRVKGGKAIKLILDDVVKNYDFKNPSQSVPNLLKAYVLIDKLENKYWKNFKTKQIKDIIYACSGLYLEASANTSYATVGDKVNLNIEAINRSNKNVMLEDIVVLPHNKSVHFSKRMNNNESIIENIDVKITDSLTYTSPYWLKEKGTLGMYNVENKDMIGKPETLRELKLNFKLKMHGVLIDFDKDVIYKYNDPVKGEVYQPFEIVPAVSAALESKVILFNESKSKNISVVISAHKNDVAGKVHLNVPNGWHVSPQFVAFEINQKREEKKVLFKVTPTDKQSEGILNVIITSDGKTYTKSLTEIDYEHIPKQVVLLPAEAKVVRLDLTITNKTIGYIQGAGDEIPKYLKEVGYQVSTIDPNSISTNVLKKYPTIIMGIRAYNTIELLKIKQDFILDYVESGGTLIVQYNTNHRLLVKDNLAPYPLELSRIRVTNEFAEVKFLDAKHKILNFPNKLTKHDFDGWVQERGLYFPEEWGKQFTPILSMHDQGESDRKGSLLVAQYGKGYYIYTGLSFFRELPAGVPGAYKLFVNMISLGEFKSK